MAKSPAATPRGLDQGGDLLHDRLSLGLFVLKREEADFAGDGPAGLQPLFVPARVVDDEAIGQFEDGGVGAVIHLEADDLERREKSARNSRMCRTSAPAPAVNRLVVVADDAERAMPPHERLGQLELDAVGVLVLVDLQVVEAGLMAGKDFGKVTEEPMREQQEIVEIDAAAALEGLLIAAISGRRQEIEIVFDELGRLLGEDAARFSSG